MKVTITARHFKAHDKLKLYAENEIRKLEKFFDNIIDCDVILDYIKPNNAIYSAEIHMKVYSQILTVSARSDDMFKSIDFAVKKLERKLRKYKGRLRSFTHQKTIERIIEDAFFEEE